MLEFLQANFAHLKRLPNVVGGGIGKRIKGNVLQSEDVVHLFVTRKTPENQLAPQEIIPKSLWVHGKRSSVRTDVIVVGKIISLHNQSTIRPVVGGVSISNSLSGAIGTLGLVVRDLTDDSAVILSNNHVMARTNAAAIGESIIQPGYGDDVGGGPVGQLKRFISLDLSNPNRVDGALASVGDYHTSVTHIGIPAGTASVEAGDLVQKSGRTSEQTVGSVLSTNAIVIVDYGENEIEFENQIVTTHMLSPGDSGSTLFTMDNKLVGLGFAGSNEISVFNAVNDVIEELNIGLFSYPAIACYKNPSRGTFFYRETNDQNHDAEYILSVGDTFSLFPDIGISQTVPLKRWKSATQYVLSISSPGVGYDLDAVLGQIATSALDSTSALIEWMDTNGNRYYTTRPTGGGIDTSQYTEIGPIGYVLT